MLVTTRQSWLGKIYIFNPAIHYVRIHSVSTRTYTAKSAAEQEVSPIAKRPLSPSNEALVVPSSSLSYHWETQPPTKEQLDYADTFFTKYPPTFLWSAPKFQSMSFSDSPEVCFLGRSNVGKSSLLNALLGKKIALTSSKPGHTKSMNAFAVGTEENNVKNRLVVLDMPGYGKGGRAEWGTEILKYLSKRKQLKRAFLLIDTTHGIKNSDEQLLALFREQDIPHEIVLSKVDRLLLPTSRKPSQKMLEENFTRLRSIMETCRESIHPPEEEGRGGAVGEIIACSAEKRSFAKKMGIDSLRHAMLQAAGLEIKLPEKPDTPVEIVTYEELFGTGSTSASER